MVNVKMVASGVIGLIIALVIGVSTVGVVVDEVANVNTTGWNFTGDTGAISILNIIPFVYIAGLVLLIVGASLALSRGNT